MKSAQEQAGETFSSLSLAQSIAARILDTQDPDQVERIGQAVQQAIADKRLPLALRRDRGDIEQEPRQYPVPAIPSSPTPETPNLLPNQQVEDSQD